MVTYFANNLENMWCDVINLEKKKFGFFVWNVNFDVGWIGYRRISHRTHHQNHEHVENDESLASSM